MKERAGAVVAVLILASCAGPASRVGSDAPSQGPSGRQLYEITTTVLESERHGPMLCPGGVLESLPPECGNVRITNWDWAAVDGEERMSGTTWGEYHVVGTYDGKAFTVTDVGPARAADDPFDDGPIEAGCPEPAGGWSWPDPERASEEDMNAAHRVARQEPDFAGFWIDQLSTPNPRTPSEAQQIVISAAFTGDLERHERELRELWGGPLCVVQHQHTYRELNAIQRELSSEGTEELGLQLLASDIDVVDNVVELQVVALDDEARQALAERYGEGTVRATAALKPVNG